MVVNALPGFNDWYKATGSAHLTPRSELRNLLTRRNYMGRFFQQGDTKKMLMGGKSLRSAVNVTLDPNVGYYTPGQKRNFQNVQGIEYVEQGWTFEEGFLSWMEAEVDLQGSGNFDAASLLQTYTDIVLKKEQNMFTSYNEHRERTYWAAPNASTMEQTQSLPAGKEREAAPINMFVNMFSATAHNVVADGLPPGFTTILGLDPRDYVGDHNIDPLTGVAKSAWDNQRVQYTTAGVAGAGQDLGRALSAAMRVSRFERMPMRPDLSSGAVNEVDSAMTKFGILTSNWGIEVYEATLEAGDERFRSNGSKDLHYSGLTFDGQPLVWVEELGNAPIYADKTNVGTGTLGGSALPTLVKEGDMENAAPHFYFLNFEDGLKEFYHSKHLFSKQTPYFLPDQPDTWVCRHDMWRNVTCEDRRCLAVVGPAYNPNLITVPDPIGVPA